MAGIYRDPPISYKSSFDRSKPKLVTLYSSDADGVTDSLKVPLFTEKGGLEELLYVEESFRNAARELNLPMERYLTHFARCLIADAQTKWNELIRDPLDSEIITYEQEEIGGYDQAIMDFTQLYCNAEDAKDIMHAYLRGPDCKKKYEVSSKTHADRMLVLLKYSTKLQGTASDLSRTEKLTVLLHSFPAARINDYGKIHCGIQETTTVQFILDHMNCLEREHAQKNKNNKGSGKRPGNSKNNNNANRKRGNANKGNNNANKKKSNPCRISGHDHEWSECPNNRYLKNYKGKSNNNKGPGSNETFQAHMKAAMESYHSDYGGRLERSIDGELVWLPLVKKLTKRPPGPKDPAITLPPAPQALDASTALLSGKSHGGELPKKRGRNLQDGVLLSA